jgi:RimJ/RimL family protein N-acetyltransferase
MGYYRKLEGELLYLAPVRLEDADKFCRWFADAEIAVNLTMFDRQMTKEREEAILSDMVKNNSQIFGIVLNDGDQLIGSCSLFDLDHSDRKAELGIMIGDKTCWNQGYGLEAIELLLDYGFNILNLNNIFLKVFDYNERAMRCYLKAGFKEIGHHREARIIMGRKYDEIFMDMLASEFSKSRLLRHLS